MSLERLIRLAKKTGDTLIVHDPVHGDDIVIMLVDNYETLLLEKDMCEQRFLERSENVSSREEWQRHVIVPDIPLPPPMPRVIDPETEEDEDRGEGMETDDMPPFPEDDVEDAERGEPLKDGGGVVEPQIVPLPSVVPPQTQSSGWHTVGGVARDRFLSGDWLRHDREKEERAAGQGVIQDDEDDDDPVFYEEPVG